LAVHQVVEDLVTLFVQFLLDESLEALSRKATKLFVLLDVLAFDLLFLCFLVGGFFLVFLVRGRIRIRAVAHHLVVVHACSHACLGTWFSLLDDISDGSFHEGSAELLDLVILFLEGFLGGWLHVGLALTFRFLVDFLVKFRKGFTSSSGLNLELKLSSKGALSNIIGC
jgi:hypothetical protein